MNERRKFLKLISYSSFFLYFNQFVKASNKFTNTKVLSSPIFKKHIISENHPESPQRIEFIKKAILEANLTDIFENYTQGRNVEYWIKLIHSEKHVESLKSLFPLEKKFHNMQCRFV